MDPELRETLNRFDAHLTLLDPHIERSDARPGRIDVHMDRQNEVIRRNAEAFDRMMAAFDRNTEAFDGNTRAFELADHAGRTTIGALDGLRGAIEDMHKDIRDQMGANARAILRLLDRLDGGTQEA
jgi:hypothetical protein